MEFLSQAQALGAPNVLKFGLEALPTAYLVIGEGTSAWFVGNVRGIPFDKPKIAAAYSLSAQSVNFFRPPVCSNNVPITRPSAPAFTRLFHVFDGFIIVGGGIKDTKTAKSLVKAGADGLVIGTLLEQTGGLKKFTDCADSEYAAAIFGLSNGIPLTFPTNHADVPSPMTKYAVGSASRPNLSTFGAPSACACERNSIR
jgi:heptaprenylglyceryl phosphate synthase